MPDQVQAAPQPATQAPQAPQAPIDNDAAISSFAREFLEDLDKNTDPDQSGRPQDEEPEAPAADAEAPQPDDTPTEEQPEAETPSPETRLIEIDMDGKKFQVPEELKGRFMADKDYRVKTQEISATRKQLEQMTANAAHLAQQAQLMAPYHAHLFAMDTRAQQLDQALRSPELANDPLEFNRVQGELGILLRNRDLFANGLNQQQTMLNNQQAQHFHEVRVQKLAADAPKLFEQFPDIQKPESQVELVRYLQKEGASEEELNHTNFSVTATKIAWKARQYDLLAAQHKASQAKLGEKVKGLPATPQSRSVSKDEQNRQLQKEWTKGGGKFTDPAFGQLLRNKLRKG